MSKPKFDPDKFKDAIKFGTVYIEKRGLPAFDDQISAEQKARIIYKQLVRDQQIQPLPQNEDTLPKIKHKLALWITKVLEER